MKLSKATCNRKRAQEEYIVGVRCGPVGGNRRLRPEKTSGYAHVYIIYKGRTPEIRTKFLVEEIEEMR